MHVEVFENTFSYLLQAQWTKGKLNCPKCQGRLGSFDFITPNKTQMSKGVFSPIQVAKNRVDCESTKPIIDKLKQVGAILHVCGLHLITPVHLDKSVRNIK